MLRRDPTAIALRETDVQEIRQLVSQQIKALREETNKEDSGTDSAAAPLEPFVATEDAKKKREALSKEERLGLQR